MQSFKISSPRMIYETMGDSTLIINLEIGHYYSLSSTASVIWESLVAGIALKSISEAFCGAYQIDPTQFANDLIQFVASLKEEGIIVENQKLEASSNEALRAKPLIDAKIYEAPYFTKYTDMEALLLADPIHEFINES